MTGISKLKEAYGHTPHYLRKFIKIPLLIYIPGVSPGIYDELTSAVDVMPTVLEFLGCSIPDYVEGQSLLPKLEDRALCGREFVVSSIPFANPGDPVRAVDNFLRMLKVATVTTITTGGYALLYSPDAGKSMLFDLSVDPEQKHNIISERQDIARETHQLLVQFMKDTNVAEYLLKPRLDLRI